LVIWSDLGMVYACIFRVSHGMSLDCVNISKGQNFITLLGLGKLAYTSDVFYPHLEVTTGGRAKRRQRRCPWRREAENLVDLQPSSANGCGRRGSRRAAATAAEHRQRRSNRRHVLPLSLSLSLSLSKPNAIWPSVGLCVLG
jgi:hypothetical protein